MLRRHDAHDQALRRSLRWIGVGRGFRLPLPPNRTCRSPASGSPVGGLTHEGTDGPAHDKGASFPVVASVENKGPTAFSTTSTMKAISIQIARKRQFGVAPCGSLGLSGDV